MKNLWLVYFRKMVFEVSVCTVKPEKLFSTKTKGVDLSVMQKLVHCHLYHQETARQPFHQNLQSEKSESSLNSEPQRSCSLKTTALSLLTRKIW